jgi:transcriptional regulator with PAS, ATPase and Fis domain
VSQVAPEAMRILLAHDYPGNVRELENLVEHAFVVGQGPVLEPEALPSYLLRASERAAAAEPARRTADDQKKALVAVLRKHGRNRTLAAEELGIHRSTLWRRMRRFGLTAEPAGASGGKAGSESASQKET